MKRDYIFQYPSAMEKLELNIDDFSNVFSKIIDDKSKQIYRKRLELSLLRSEENIGDLIQLTVIGEEFYRRIKKKKIIIYGAGLRGQRLQLMFPELSYRFYVDKKKIGKVNNVPIISDIGKIEISNEDIVLVSNLVDSDQIRNELIDFGISPNNVICLSAYDLNIIKDQYFEERCISHFKISDGVFIDAGGYDGFDTLKFLSSHLYKNNICYIFEPDETNYYQCQGTLGHFDNVFVRNEGISNKKDIMEFISDGVRSRFESNSQHSAIEVIRIDDIFKDMQVGYIKMDIEGSERDALFGAEQVIKRDHPNLMLSIYHRPEDIFEIPKILLSFNSNYQFAFGHYSVGGAYDTVLYAFDS